MRDDAKNPTFHAGPDLLRDRVREEYSPTYRPRYALRVPLALLTAADRAEIERRRKLVRKAG